MSSAPFTTCGALSRLPGGRGHRAAFVAAVVAAACGSIVLPGCEEPKAPGSSFFDERIAPVLEVGCVQQTTGCHVASSKGTAVGNLDLSSYDALMQRADTLHPFGPYPVGLLLMKAGDPVTIQVETFGAAGQGGPANKPVAITTDVRHNAGSVIALDSTGYARLRQWIQDGYGRNGLSTTSQAQSSGACRNGVGTFPGFDAGKDPDDPSFLTFAATVQPALKERCAGSSCHGSRIADLFLACGDTPEEVRWNYFVAVQHLTDPAASSELLRRPLSTNLGGTYHEGGDVFVALDDKDYVTLRTWAETVVASQPAALAMRDVDVSEGLRYFANRVQPVLVRKGCMFQSCHSTAMFHDLRLRTGSEGVFSRVATYRNYEMARLQLAVQSSNPNASRLIAKNLFPPPPLGQVPAGEGIVHRGGSLFEDFASASAINPATPDDCASVDADRGDLNAVPAYCVLVRWHQIERAAAIARGEIVDTGVNPLRVVWIDRPIGVGSPLDFDTYRPGAILRAATLGGTAAAPALSAVVDLGASCGLTGADIRTPAVSWDGKTIAFAARTNAQKPLRLYTMGADGSSCRPLAGVAAAEELSKGVLTHDFDPAFAPDGRLVFASTRGGSAGATRTPASLSPNADLFVFDPRDGSIRQLTFLLNQELNPNFLADGRVILSTEKREPDFYQIAGRRQNLDGTDYHPLFAQRGSIGFGSATEIVELSDRNLAMVSAPMGVADGAGGLAIVNRSLGPDQRVPERDPADRFYQHSLDVALPGVFGSQRGAFRSPAALPDGRVLVSCALDAANAKASSFDFDLCVYSPLSRQVVRISQDATRADIEAVAVFARPNYGVFEGRFDEVNGRTELAKGETDAIVRLHDFPLLATLLFENIRTNRPIDPRIGGFDILVPSPPPDGTTSFDQVKAQVVSDAFGSVYVSRRVLGHVPLFADGSATVRLAGGMPVLLRVTDKGGAPLSFPSGAPFMGEMTQREQMQFYPGERLAQSIPRRFFNGLCGGCHGSITGRELDVAVNVDILTRASQTQAASSGETDLR